MFDIVVDDDGTVRLSGRFDASQVDTAQRVFVGISGKTVVDCEELKYISSAGLGVLFATQKRLMDSGDGLRLINLNPHIREVFQLAGFDTIFEIG